MQTLHYRVIPEHTARLQALMAGQVDMVSGLQVEDIATLKDQGMTVAVQPNPQIKSIALRNLHGRPKPAEGRARASGVELMPPSIGFRSPSSSCSVL